MLELLVYLFLPLGVVGGASWGLYRWRSSILRKQKLEREKDLEIHNAFTRRDRSAPRRYYHTQNVAAIPPHSTVAVTRPRDDDGGSGSIIAGAALGYALGRMHAESRDEPEPFSAGGGSFGGAGASESWDSSPSPAVDSSPAAESYTDSSAGDGSGM